MEISREKALDILRNWKKTQTVVGLHFAARGGTSGSCSRDSPEVSSRIIFRNDAAVLSFGLCKAHFALAAFRQCFSPRVKVWPKSKACTSGSNQVTGFLSAYGTELNSERLNFAGRKNLPGPLKRIRNTRSQGDEGRHSERGETEILFEPALTPALSTKH